MREVLAARNAVYLVFGVNGVAFASWASRIPDAKAQLGLGASDLGLVLLAMSAGAVLGLPSSGWLNHNLGVATAVRLGVSATLVGLVGAGLAISVLGSVPLLALALFVAGLGIGVWDVAMNLEGAVVEQRLGTTIMPRFHAAFSGGTVLSALVGAGLSALSVPVGLHLTGAAVVVGTLALAATTRFLGQQGARHETAQPEAQPGAEEPAVTTPQRGGSGVGAAWRDRRTLAIGAVVMVAAFTEGTANDWLSVALVEGHGVPAWAGVLGFATFLTFMTAGRLFGGVLLDRYGRVPVLRLMFTMAGLGSLLVVFGSVPLAFLGAALWGAGVALGFPVGISASADDPARAAARMSVVSTIGYTAFLAGPPLLGFVGEHSGVLQAMLLVGGAVIIALVMLPAVREPEREEQVEPATTDPERCTAG